MFVLIIIKMYLFIFDSKYASLTVASSQYSKKINFTF